MKSEEKKIAFIFMVKSRNRTFKSMTILGNFYIQSNDLGKCLLLDRLQVG